MIKLRNLYSYFHTKLLSEKAKHATENAFVTIAIVSFLLHLIVIGLVDFHFIDLKSYSSLLSNPISAIYTPFSFILIYEVYLLVYYLPKSTTNYIGKQYEIITLLIIRRIFKDLSKLDFSDKWYQSQMNINFAADLIGTILLFFMIYKFYSFNKELESLLQKTEKTPKIIRFIKLKNVLALFLLPLFIILSVYSLSNWIYNSYLSVIGLLENMKNINTIFFDEFFTVLILVEVLLLLFSFFLTDKFSKVIRNSGFLISTILIKISFGTEGVLNTFLIVIAVLFGLTILYLHNKYEKHLHI